MRKLWIVPVMFPAVTFNMCLSGVPKERSKLSNFSFETMFAFYKEFSEWMGCYLQKSQGNPEYILHSSLVRWAIIYVCSTFICVNSNQKSVLHLTENFSGWHCFTTVLASNIAKWKIKSHAPAEQHAAEYIYNDLQLPCPVRIIPKTFLFVAFLLAQFHIACINGIQATRKRASKFGSWSCEV